MNRKLAAARALVRHRALPVPERRRDLNQLIVEVRRDYDRQISQIRPDIAAIGMSAAHVVWRAVVKFLTRAPAGAATGAAAIAKLRVKLAEVHTAKFAAL